MGEVQCLSKFVCLEDLHIMESAEFERSLPFTHTVFEEKLFHSFDVKVFGDLHASRWERFNVTLNFAILIELHILESAEFERSFCHTVYCKERPSEFKDICNF